MRALGQCTVVLEGVVNGEAAEQVAEALEALRPGGALLLDVSRATGLEAVLLARLVRLLKSRREPLSIRIVGLRQRECQLLGYLGLDLDPSSAALTADLPLSASG